MSHYNPYGNQGPPTNMKDNNYFSNLSQYTNNQNINRSRTGNMSYSSNYYSESSPDKEFENCLISTTKCIFYFFLFIFSLPFLFFVIWLIAIVSSNDISEQILIPISGLFVIILLTCVIPLSICFLVNCLCKCKQNN
jgi:hypothetical protein